MKQEAAHLLGKIFDIVALNKIVGVMDPHYSYTNDKFLGCHVRDYLDAFVKNTRALLPTLYEDFSDEIMVLQDDLRGGFRVKYQDYRDRPEYAGFAVISVDRKQLLAIKGSPEQGMDEYGDCENRYIDDRLLIGCREGHAGECDEPKFNLPRHGRENTYLTEICDLLGYCTLMSTNQLCSYGVECPMISHKNGDMPRIPTIVLCMETLKELATSFRQNSQSSKYKQEVGGRFGVGLSDSYFDKKVVDMCFSPEDVNEQYRASSVCGNIAEYLTFAHEFAHLLLGHLYGNVKLRINRETQANFLASILLNDPIASIYMQYKTCFQPMEYQRTMLLYNDFNVANITKALKKVLILK